MEQFKTWIRQFTPKHDVDLPIPEEPDPVYLLGNRWADYGLTFAFAVLLPVLRSLLRTYIFTPLGYKFMFPKGVIKLNEKQQERLRKWHESCWKMTVFLTFAIIALSVSIGESWFWETRQYWNGCTRFPPCNLRVSKGVLLFYTIETGFYIQAIHFLLFHEVRRKDWLESMIHHVATVALLLYSYTLNFTRIGVMVLLVHDASDIFLEAAKLARYTKNQFLAMLFFAIFTVIWIITRNVIFPFVIIRSTLTETLYYGDMHNINVEPHYTIFNGLLILLEVLHIYWTYLIFQVLYKQLRHGDAGDVRENEEEHED